MNPSAWNAVLLAAGLVETAVLISLAMIGVTFFLAFYRLVRGPSIPDRVVAFDLISLASVGSIAAYSVFTDQHVMLDAATVVALVAFLGTVAFAQYVERRGRDD